MAFILWGIIGLLAGWMANFFTRGRHGIIFDLIIGLVGAIIGGIIGVALMGVGQAGVLGTLVLALIGALILITVIRLFESRRLTG